MNLKAIFTLSSFFLLAQSYAGLISEKGTTPLTLKDGTGVQVSISPTKDKKDGMLSFIVEYAKKVSGGMDLKVAKGKWRAFFEAPNKLWVYDGDGAIHLSVVTVNPNVSTASSSTKVPTLLKKAPKEIKNLLPK